MELCKINKDDLIIDDGCVEDIVSTTLALNDYDWMQYILKTRLHTKDLGVLNIKFEYYGAKDSMMEVEQTLNGATETIVYEYASDIFKKYIICFMANHIAHWGSKYAFDGEDVILDFYNEVLEKGEREINV